MDFPIFIEKYLFQKWIFRFFFQNRFFEKFATSKTKINQNWKDWKIWQNAFIFKKPVVLLVQEGPSEGGGSRQDKEHSHHEAQEEHDGSTNTGERPPPPQKKPANANRASRIDMTPEI